MESNTSAGWRIEISDWKTIDLESAKFLFDQAVDNLKFTHEVAGAITNRSITIMLCLVPFLSLSLGFSITVVKSDGVTSILLMICFVALCWCVVTLLRNVFPYGFMFPGREPKEFFLGNFFNSSDQLLALYLNEIEATQIKIDYNNNQNSDRMKRLKKVLQVVIVSVVAAITLSIVNISKFN